ncbi:hypothetical protein N7537_012258 [Penicillium hordei]|uniref:Uncharacterized protein n=1 Tax=Penicillium hordei TaxID=40994 RepID=A0AAD6DNC0_9EURO|nr:uncharacterized protein N7537_012258 [Penicillium hordei]KAJ5589580.1 hypothetical protein N7537_012258 [Penicillium hordei]
MFKRLNGRLLPHTFQLQHDSVNETTSDLRAKSEGMINPQEKEGPNIKIGFQENDEFEELQGNLIVISTKAVVFCQFFSSTSIMAKVFI